LRVIYANKYNICTQDITSFFVSPVFSSVFQFFSEISLNLPLFKLAKAISKGKEANNPINPVFLDYGHAAAQTERECSQKVVNYIRSYFKNEVVINELIEISLVSQLFSWCNSVAFTGNINGNDTCEIQNRNMVLYSILGSYLFACADEQGIEKATFQITSGFINKEMKDCSSEFFKTMERLFSKYRSNLKISIKFVTIQY